MWIFTTKGAFSIALNPRPAIAGEGGRTLSHVIRGRSLPQMEAVQEVLLPDMDSTERGERLPIARTPERDYQYRIFATETEVRTLLLLFSESIDYDNFKDAAGKAQPQWYVRLLGKVWGLFYDAAEYERCVEELLGEER